MSSNRRYAPWGTTLVATIGELVKYVLNKCDMDMIHVAYAVDGGFITKPDIYSIVGGPHSHIPMPPVTYIYSLVGGPPPTSPHH